MAVFVAVGVAVAVCVVVGVAVRVAVGGMEVAVFVAVGVAVAVRVAVDVAVRVAVGVAVLVGVFVVVGVLVLVGTAVAGGVDVVVGTWLPYSTAPLSRAVPCGRGAPRWSVVTAQALAFTRSIAGLPPSSAWVNRWAAIVGQRPELGLALLREFAALKRQVLSLETFPPSSAMTSCDTQFLTDGLSRIVFLSVGMELLA